MTEKKYINFEASRGFPAGERIRYECEICGETLLSMPQNAAACKCRNIIVDADAGRISVKSPEKMKAYEVEAEN
ncbi:hypothetical protein [Pseudomonas sp. GM48]|uniref:hypothetical protein n=1 Tax=Pseudomonas sp. GM48 TaxID=1144330 RepID=UPI0012F94C6B|nr:hypothetical protein [Pseudomonas sp. GM48]